MILQVVACLLFAGSVLGNTPALSNNYMDGLLGNELKNALRFKSLDPKTLPDFTTNFTAKLFVSPANVQTDYSWGKLHGLSVIKRSRSCSAPRWNAGPMGNATLNCSLTFPQLRVEYSAWVKSPITKLTVLANISNAEILVEVTGSRSWPVPSLRTFSVVRPGTVLPRFNGLSTPMQNMALGNFTNTFSNKVSALVYQVIASEMQTVFRDAVKNTRNMPMPN